MKSITLILAALAVMFSSAVFAQDDSTSTATKPEETAKETSTAATDNVRRAVFTTSVVDKEPVDELASIPSDAGKICFFSQVVNLTCETITHRWLHNGKAMAEVTINIGGPRWRAYSRKTLPGFGTGSWSVEIVDGYGNTLHRAELAYDNRPQEPAATE
jgi:zona occludens toxin (predicted ATPase)